ncbi:MAG: hypothetical protein COU30_00640 [Candidatus Magasanikbacteria bacterium CG10_big_fil_rev_8_21_14_0_10_38_6]|uniref:Phage shock protein PspC N-terminal domain-containing protein n=1 Tax=Candidatus Magasanikbacteria bacterium CG10_big_fil_rev_8_21_14_0_10_38_6 TaxID=1974647 RepID=A0A2M6P248_9BACT|nr:MAG: hypothetical protein COU30_00640 [Candidatus Magasanikbacteria bacterium CG10_big_fil_rev_8_21_14_0_10_38_6]
MKKLTRSKTNRVWTGIIGGMGEYLNVDPTILRLLFIILVIFTGFVPGVLAYVLAMFIVPEKEDITQ